MPSYNIGINFRATSGYVTDPTDTIYCLGDPYPVTRNTVTTGQAVTFGWLESDATTPKDLAAYTRDRDAGISPKLAGVNFKIGADLYIFRIDLPASGLWTVRVAAGDADSSNDVDWDILNSNASTVLLSQAEASVTTGNWKDATGVTRTSSSDWVSNNASADITLSGTACYLRMNVTTNATLMSHINFSQAASGATVSTITGSTVTEGTNVVFTVNMSGTGGGSFAYSWSGTATSADYTTTLTSGMFTTTGGSGSVVMSGSNVVVDSTVTQFQVSVPTSTDTLDEDAETVRLVLGGITASSGTITDDDAEPSITGTTSVTVDAGDPAVITYTLSAVSGRTITRTLTVTDGTATGGGTDYTSTIDDTMFATTSGSGTVTISGSTVTIPAGVGAFTLTIPTTA